MNYNYTKHKFNVFPPMNLDEYEQLKTDIKQNGYDSTLPITLYEGEVLDGWNRYQATNELGITPIYEQFTGTQIEAIYFVMRTNKRRNLSSSQWAAIAVTSDDIVNQIKDEVEKNRRTKQAVTQKTSDEDWFDKISESVDNEEELSSNKFDNTPIKTDKIIADTFNTNDRYINKANKIKVDHPDLFDEIFTGNKTITEVEKELKITDRKNEIQKMKDDINSGKMSLPEGLFQVIMMDVPWPYQKDTNTRYDPEHYRVASPYPEMSLDEIYKLDIPADENSILFFWTTQRYLEESFKIVKSYGFDYKGIITWDKDMMGIGVTLRMQTEFCILAFKGKPVWDLTDCRDIICEKRREHSRKPETLYEIINNHLIGNKLDYFSRENRKGWSSMGYEKFITK